MNKTTKRKILLTTTAKAITQSLDFFIEMVPCAHDIHHSYWNQRRQAGEKRSRGASRPPINQDFTARTVTSVVRAWVSKVTNFCFSAAWRSSRKVENPC